MMTSATAAGALWHAVAQAAGQPLPWLGSAVARLASAQPWLRAWGHRVASEDRRIARAWRAELERERGTVRRQLRRSTQKLRSLVAGRPLARRKWSILWAGETEWLERGGRFAPPGSVVASPQVRCRACVESAATAQAGEANIILPPLDLREWTMVRFGASTVRVTNLRPFSLLFRSSF